MSHVVINRSEPPAAALFVSMSRRALDLCVRRRGIPVIALVSLLGAAATLHVLARLRMEMARRQFALQDVRTVLEMQVIDFVDGHVWIAAVYVGLFVAGVLWHSRAGTTGWPTFTVLGVPALAYVAACWHICGKFILFVVPGPGDAPP